MTKTEFYILNSLYNGSQGRTACSGIEEAKALSDREAYQRLVTAGLISRSNGSLTQAGLDALMPYQVDNAVILAAGASTRFIPCRWNSPRACLRSRGNG